MTTGASASSGAGISDMFQWQCHWYHDADANGITWPKSSCCTSFWLCWPKEYNGAIDDAVHITWSHQCQWHCMMKSNVTTHFICLNIRNTMVPLMIWGHHVTQMSVWLASNDQKSCCTSFWLSWPQECSGTIDDTTGIISMLMSMMSHDKRSHVAPHFDHCDLRKAVMSLMRLSTSQCWHQCSGIAWHQLQC